MRAIIFGIGGVGKTSVVNEIINRLPFERLHWGQIAVDLAKQQNLITDYDQLRRQNIVIQKKLQAEVATMLADKMNQIPEKNYLIETHAALKTPQGYLPGLNLEVLQLLKPDIIIVITADPEMVLKRRQSDTSRTRDDDKTMEEVKLNLYLTNWYASTFAAISGAMLLSVENKEGDLAYASNTIIDTLQKYLESQTKSV